MKKILFAMTATAIVLCATSCSDYFLDLTPTDQQTEANYYKSAKEFEVAAKSTYSFYGFKDMSETVNGTKYTRTFYDIMDNNSDIISGVHSIAAGTQHLQTILTGHCAMLKSVSVTLLSKRVMNIAVRMISVPHLP